MSGFIAILHEDGRPVDEETLWSLTNYMRYRGPDEQQIWRRGHVGLGHAMLRTTDEMVDERQPMTLNGEVWITADARIDDRNILRRKLENKGRILEEPVTDVAYILHAYEVWGEKCVHHLMGDFAFVIWDERDQRFFCARDHFGVKPLYFTRKSGYLVISNTLNCLRMHPIVGSELNRSAIESYLRVGTYSELFTTTFKDIQRLPNAFCLEWSDNELYLEQYWNVPVEEPIYYKNPHEYVDHFLHLLVGAINDRLRTDKIALLMSGGMDSSSIAALAINPRYNPDSNHLKMRAYSGTYRSSIEYDEAPWAELVAKHLNLDLKWLKFDLPPLFDHWDESNWNTVEPSDGLITNRFYLSDGKIDRFSRVCFYGYGADAILYPSRAYLLSLVQRGRLIRLASDVMQYYRFRRRFPPPYLRTALKQKLSRHENLLYLNPITEPYYNSTELPFSANIKISNEANAPWRPEAASRLSSAYWPRLLEGYDPGQTGLCLEARHPFFDIRLVNYSLRLPSVPWCVQKEILRQTMAPLLPTEILGRMKQTMRANPYDYAVRFDRDSPWKERLREIPMVREFVDVELTISSIIEYTVDNQRVSQDRLDPEQLLRPYALAYWLKNIQSYRQYSPGGNGL